MAPLFHDGALLQNDDPRSIAYRADAVRCDERGSAGKGFAEGAENLRLGVRIDRRQHVIEQYNARRLRQRARQRGSLFLAAREVDSALTQNPLVLTT